MHSDSYFTQVGSWGTKLFQLMAWYLNSNDLSWTSVDQFAWHHIDSLVQDCSNSSANALELLQSCTTPLISSYKAPVSRGSGSHQSYSPAGRCGNEKLKYYNSTSSRVSESRNSWIQTKPVSFFPFKSWGWYDVCSTQKLFNLLRGYAYA